MRFLLGEGQPWANLRIENGDGSLPDIERSGRRGAERPAPAKTGGSTRAGDAERKPSWLGGSATCRRQNRSAGRRTADGARRLGRLGGLVCLVCFDERKRGGVALPCSFCGPWGEERSGQCDSVSGGDSSHSALDNGLGRPSRRRLIAHRRLGARGGGADQIGKTTSPSPLPR